MLSPSALRTALCVGPLLATGCSFGARLSLLPTVDTARAVGVEARAMLLIGLSGETDKQNADNHPRGGLLAVPFSATAGIEHARVGARSVLELGGGIEYAEIAHKPDLLGFRTALSFSEIKYGTTANFAPGGTTDAALLATLWKGPGDTPWSHVALGPAMEASYFDPSGGPIGRFGLGVTLDWYGFTHWGIY